ncbi:MAG: autoinducer binding domain-containing protein [Pseudomonadota bacterium]
MQRNDYFHSLCSNDVGIFDLVASKAKKMGFEFSAFGMKLPFPLSMPRIVLQNNYLDSWNQRYAAQAYLGVDPTVRHGLRSDNLIVWDPEQFRDAGDLWEDANAHGLYHGLGVARRLENGTIGMLNLARGADPISVQEAQHVATEIALMTDMLVVTGSNALTELHVPESLASLSEREKEILRWTADGKTSSEIGQILHLSLATVNFHVNKMLVKLNAVNKTQAVVKALMLGML